MRLAFVAASWVFFSACHSAGPYGYSRTYSPLDAEETALENSRELDPVMMDRVKEEWKKGRVRLFGVVKSRKDEKGSAYLALGMRSLAPRNLCDDADEDTCRVTVSEREHAAVYAIVRLTGEDDFGNGSVRPGSLIRVIGKLTEEADASDGAPVVRAEYYRHWPRGQYVTTGDSEHMRR